MKKSRLHSFSTHSLTTQAMKEVRGGYSFCEWYMDYCISNHQSPVKQMFSYMMQLDHQYGFTPDMSGYPPLPWD